SRHLIYSFFFLRHSRAASLFFSSLISRFLSWSSPLPLEMFPPCATTATPPDVYDAVLGLVNAMKHKLPLLTRNEELLPLSVLHDGAACRRIRHGESVDALGTFTAGYLNRRAWQHCNKTCM